jgi:hypothetical protein
MANIMLRHPKTIGLIDLCHELGLPVQTGEYVTAGAGANYILRAALLLAVRDRRAATLTPNFWLVTEAWTGSNSSSEGSFRAE